MASRFAEYRVLSLQTGLPIAEIDRPIIDPKKLKIIAFAVKNGIVDKNNILRIGEIREMGLVNGTVGLIINSEDDLTNPADVPKIKDVVALNFRLIGHKVLSARGKRLGTVNDYLFDSESFVIQQIMARRPLIYTFSYPNLLIGRTQIAEIDNTRVILKDTAPEISKPLVIPANMTPDFINPFREPQGNNKDN